MGLKINLEKQSVRTTFDLSEKCLTVLEQLLFSHGIKPKELFDIMLDKSLIDFVVKMNKKNGLKQKDNNRKRKTIVISKETLRKLNDVSKELNVSRNILVENLIMIYWLSFEEYKQKVEKALKIINDTSSKIYSAKKKIEEILGDDPITEKWGIIEIHIMNLETEIEQFLINNKPIEY